jgi:hypothetical protein
VIFHSAGKLHRYLVGMQVPGEQPCKSTLDQPFDALFKA